MILSGTRPANHDGVEHAGDSAGQPLNRLFGRHRNCTQPTALPRRSKPEHARCSLAPAGTSSPKPASGLIATRPPAPDRTAEAPLAPSRHPTASTGTTGGHGRAG